jgi:hypothetical protein
LPEHDDPDEPQTPPEEPFEADVLPEEPDNPDVLPKSQRYCMNRMNQPRKLESSGRVI